MSNNLWINETWINATENYSSGESEPYETWTDSVGRLFRELQREHGRCQGSIYIDTEEGKAKRVGWVFHKRRRYTDCNETYLAETWITLHEKPPTKTVKYHYKELG